MKKLYQEPELELVWLTSGDIITGSGEESYDETGDPGTVSYTPNGNNDDWSDMY